MLYFFLLQFQLTTLFIPVFFLLLFYLSLSVLLYGRRTFLKFAFNTNSVFYSSLSTLSLCFFHSHLSQTVFPTFFLPPLSSFSFPEHLCFGICRIYLFFFCPFKFNESLSSFWKHVLLCLAPPQTTFAAQQTLPRKILILIAF